MMGRTPHRILNPSSLPAPSGFSHVVVPTKGRLVILGGQAGLRSDGTLVGESIVDQFERACANVVEALLTGGARPEHMVSLQIYVTSLPEYRMSLQQVGDAYRTHFGKHYPAISLFEVTGLFEHGAKVELVATAVVPE